MDVKISDIKVVGRKRELNEEKIRDLANSFKLLGQLQPIVINQDYTLLAGLHRLEAAKLLGWETIKAEVVSGSQLEDELIEIDENLIRNDLTVLEQAELLQRRNEILKELGLRAKRGDNQFTNRGETVSPLQTTEDIIKEFSTGPDTVSGPVENLCMGSKEAPVSLTTKDIAKEIGLSERSIQRHIFIAQNLVPEVKDKIRNTPIADSTTQLLELARLKPEEQIEVAKHLENKKTVAEAIQEHRREKIKKQLEEISAKPVNPVTKKYDVIVIDPPWEMKKIERDVAPNQVEFDYPTMTVDEIKNIELPAKDDCHIWLWTTQKYLPDAFQIFEHWGVKYICTFVWHKQGGFQPFGLPQYNCEFILYGRKGTPEFFDLKDFKVCFEAPRAGHSVKPDYFYEMVKRVTAGSRLDMFGRRRIDGFDSWGKEAQ